MIVCIGVVLVVVWSIRNVALTSIFTVCRVLSRLTSVLSLLLFDRASIGLFVVTIVFPSVKILSMILLTGVCTLVKFRVLSVWISRDWVLVTVVLVVVRFRLVRLSRVCEVMPCLVSVCACLVASCVADRPILVVDIVVLVVWMPLLRALLLRWVSSVFCCIWLLTLMLCLMTWFRVWNVTLIRDCVMTTLGTSWIRVVTLAMTLAMMGCGGVRGVGVPVALYGRASVVRGSV